MVDLTDTKNESPASRPKTNSFVSKAVYWTLSTLLVIALIFIVFVGVGALIEGGGFKTNRVMGFGIGIVGAIMLLIAIRNPMALWGQVMKKEPNDPQKEKGDPLASSLAGVTFMPRDWA